MEWIVSLSPSENVRVYGERWHFFWHTIKEREKGSKGDCDGKSRYCIVPEGEILVLYSARISPFFHNKQHSNTVASERKHRNIIQQM